MPSAYTHESVVNELKANGALTFVGIDDLGCPSQSPCEVHGSRCPGDPLNCGHCEKRPGCLQRVRIYENNKFLCFLEFAFTISVRSQGGFVPGKDSTLKLLIRRKAINQTKLDCVTLS